MKNKQIIFNVELARPTKVKQGIPPTVFTNDTNIVEFIFNVTDLEVPETATAEVNIFMRDGSFFQKDALVEGSEIRYTLSDTEGKHAGLAQIQMTLSYENKRYSTNIFQFKIDSGLNDKVAVEVLIQDWDTITTEARQYLEQLADYGTEFSEIIADAQTQVNANVVEGAVENKFNALEAEYAQDITSLKQSDISLTAQLQQTMTQAEFDSWVSTLLDGGPSVFFDTLNALNAAYPKGSAGVALVRETDPAKIYAWNGTAWQDFGNYQGLEVKAGTITTSKLAEKTVTSQKIDIMSHSTNHFNSNTVIKGKTLDQSTGAMIDNATAWVSEPIHARSGQPFIMSANVARAHQYDEKGLQISASSLKTFTVAGNASIIRLVGTGTGYKTAQLNEGTTLLPYEEYTARFAENKGTIIKPTIRTVTKEAMTENSVDPFAIVPFRKSKNLFNRKNVVDNVTFSSSGGAEVVDTNRVANRGFIRTKPNQPYTRSYSSAVVAYFDKNGEWGQTTTYAPTDLTYTSPNWAYYKRVSITRTSAETFMLAEGTVDVPFEEYVFELESTNEYPIKINGQLLPQPTGGVTGTTMRPYRSYSYTKLSYPDLVASLPGTGCVVENLGKASDGVTDLYGLSFGDTATKPVIFLVGNQHGSEWRAVNYGIDFMKTVAGTSRFYDPELLATLTNTFAFYLIVSANPWGYINEKYTTLTGVNLNRNWDHNWDTMPLGEGTTQYKGTEPFSEPEAKIVRDKFLALRPYMMVDLHTTGETPGGIDTGKVYTTHRELLLGVANKTAELFDDALLFTQEWNTGNSSTSVGWSGKQISKEGTPCIPTIIEQPIHFEGNYGLSMLFMLSLYGRDYYLNR